LVNTDRMVKQFNEFVRIPSPSFKEKQFAERVKKELTSLGITCQEDRTGKEIGGDCGNLFARVPGDKKKPTLLFSAHLDTVGTGESIEPHIKNGVIYSSGKTILGADDKVAMVAILEALRVLKEKKLPHGPIELLFTVAEEQGLKGSKHFDCKKLKAQAGFVFDSSDPVGGIVNRAPAYDAIFATITGRASHAGASPEEGISAIQIASAAIAYMRLGRIDPKTTANIGIISGGVARNVIPEICCLEAEARSHSYPALKKQVQHMLACLHAATKKYGGKMEVEIEREFEAFYAPNSSLPVQMAKAAAKRLGLPFSTRASGGGADTAFISAGGVPTVTVNCGYCDAHSVTERVAISDLTKTGAFALALISES
jgi:tripeptide aminopeptidase